MLSSVWFFVGSARMAASVECLLCWTSISNYCPAHEKKNSRHAAASHLIISREFIVGASPFSRGRRGTGRQSVFVITTQRPCHKVKWRQRTHTPVGSVYILAFRTYKERVRSIKGKAYTHTGCVCVCVCTIELQCSCSHCIGRRWSTTKSFRLWYLDKRLFNFATLQLSIPLLFIGHSFFLCWQ